ncbi:MAG: queuosine precursor transporter [Halobacteriales archaeon]
MSSEARAGPRVGPIVLVALFVTALVTAQLTASKVLAVDIPVALPVTGDELVLPGAALAYSVTFLASDCYAELYGRRATTVMVNVAFGMNFVLLALVWSTILAPVGPGSVDPGAFRTVLGSGTNIVLASLVAYLVSQNWDVFAFHWIRQRTAGAHLWLRNIGSTATSQALDTVLFVALGFNLVPRLIGIGPVLGLDALAALIVGQYLLKLAIALADTPVVYAVVRGIRRVDHRGGPATA